MGSNPIIGTPENAILLGEIVRIGDFVNAHGRARKRTKTLSIWQVFVKPDGPVAEQSRG